MAQGQNVLDILGAGANQLSTLKVSVADSLSRDPLPYASVYLTEKQDTVIGYFALTDTLGTATIKEVPYGVYLFHVEMLGFKPYVKELYLRQAQQDMGMVKMQVDDEFIRAALISDIGNPIVIKKDTIEYHAAAFLQDKNAMLKDLLSRMPGIEITEAGKVRVGGEDVSRITVNGKTFFFEDQAMALNNLPASIVDKIRVIDKKSDQERITGIADGQRTKEVDVALKKEYADGLFGNLAAQGGTTLDLSDSELRDDRGLLYGGKAMVSAYNPKDQLTFIGNGQNYEGKDPIVIMSSEDYPLMIGLSKRAQLGLNGVTSRVKDVELAAASSYSFTSTEAANKSLRTTFLETGDLTTESGDKGIQNGNIIRANVSAKKETGNFTFNLNTYFSRSDTHTSQETGTKTTREMMLLNSSESTLDSDFLSRDFGVNASLGYSGIGGNRLRTLSGSMHYNHGISTGTSQEFSRTLISNAEQILDLHYDRLKKANRSGVSLTYTEPLGNNFRLTANTGLSAVFSYSRRTAFNADDSANDYYSTLSDCRYLSQKHGAAGVFSTNGWQFSVGADAQGIQNRLLSRSRGVEALTGDEWIWSVIPKINISYFKESTSLYWSVSGMQNSPSSSQMLPTLNVTDPTQITAGNIYLRPDSQIHSGLQFQQGFPKRFSSLTAYLGFFMRLHNVITANWYDTHGVSYSVPINAKRPVSSISANIGYNTPVNKERTLNFEVELVGQYSGMTNYRAARPMEPLEAGQTDYATFMAQFWGDESGDRFYSGASGFEVNNTDHYHTMERIRLKYNKEPWSVSLGFLNSFDYAAYSLSDSESIITTDNTISLTGNYTTPHRFIFNTELHYNFYTGYPEGYGLPELQWDQSISKDIGTFTLSITAHDILNQTRNIFHAYNADYTENKYRLVMGRYVLFGIRWNFGKMNAIQNRRAQRAQMSTMYGF